MVTGFQRDRKGHNAVAVFVDRFSKQAHFAPTSDTVTAEGYAQLYLEHVYRHHGLARTITSDRDPRFTVDWWDSFHRALGTRLKLSTAYHPQTDGQSERAIRTLQLSAPVRLRARRARPVVQVLAAGRVRVQQRAQQGNRFNAV